MGRKKIAIRKISDGRRRQVTFVRRKFGLMKKAYELAVLCQCDVALMMITNEQKLYLYSNKPMETMISSFHDIAQSGEDCEIIDDDEMIRLIERGKDGLDEYFGGPEEDDEEENESEKPPRKRNSLRGQPSIASPSKRIKSKEDESSIKESPSEDRLSSAQVMTPTYYFPAPTTAYPTMIPPQFFFYPQSVVNSAHHVGMAGDEESKHHLSSGQNSALNLPPLPFAFAQHLTTDGSSSSNSLPPNADGGAFHPSGISGMFAGGIYYPFGSHHQWNAMSGMNHSGSSSDIRQTPSTSDLVAAAEAAASNDASMLSRSSVSIDCATESIKYKETAIHEEAAKSMSDKAPKASTPKKGSAVESSN